MYMYMYIHMYIVLSNYTHVGEEDMKTLEVNLDKYKTKTIEDLGVKEKPISNIDQSDNVETG